MAFTVGTNPYRQSRVSQDSTTQGQVEGPLPLLSFGGAPSTTKYDEPNPSFAARDRQAREAVLAQSSDQVAGFIAATFPAPAASLPPGARLFDLPVVRLRTVGIDNLTQADASEIWMLRDAVNPGVQSVDLPPRAAARMVDYTIAATMPRELVGRDAMAAGAQSVELPPRAAARARDYSVTASFPLELIGQDAVAAGAQSVDLPPRAVARARDYSIAAAFPLELIGQDALPVGAQLSGNAPAGARRAVDYSHLQPVTLNLLGQDAVTPGKQLAIDVPAGPRYARPVFDQPNVLLPLGSAVIVPLPYGAQVFDLPLPPVYARLRDYSHAQPLALNLFGRDAVNAGAQLTGPAPAGARRASTLSETGVNLTVELVAVPPVIPQGQSTAASELAPRGPSRLVDYTITAGPLPELVGKDQFYDAAGQPLAYDWQLPPRAPARLRDYSIAASFPLELVSADRFYGAAGQTQTYDWPLPGRGAARTFALYDPGSNQTLALVAGAPVVFPAGDQSYDLPPRGPQRAREYGQTANGTGYIGKDSLYAASGEAPAYDWPNPRAPQRARDYTWLQSFPLYIYQQLPPGTSTAASELPPKGPLRLRDYTHLGPVQTQLIGKDRIFGAPGQTQTYDWPNPNTGARRARDYSVTQSTYTLALIKSRDLAYIVGAPQNRWDFAVPHIHARWGVTNPQSRWSTKSAGG